MNQGFGYPSSLTSRPPASDHHPIVAPTLSGAPGKRIVADAGASQAIGSVRFVIDPVSKADALQVLKGVGGECIVMNRNDSLSRSVPNGVTAVYGVAIGTAVSGYVVTPGATDSEFLAAMFRLDFASVDAVKRVNFKTIEVLASAGTLNARYMDIITEGVSYA
ncbi:MAG: hypothetical protein KDA34_14955 [Phycisphaerales bacterium]|nr:hypothetical protein [Phycisphaerales bacterium]